MHGLPKISAIKMKEFLHARVDEFAEELVESLNQAQPGRLIADSEEVVRKLIHEFGQAAYQAALQQKVDAAEAAFSPSGGNSDGPSHGPSGEQAVAQQRSATQQRAHNQRTDPLAKTLVNDTHSISAFIWTPPDCTRGLLMTQLELYPRIGLLVSQFARPGEWTPKPRIDVSSPALRLIH